jgi:hypothetical protein
MDIVQHSVPIINQPLSQTQENHSTIVAEQINQIYQVGFEILTAARMKMAVFWVVVPCSLVEVYRRSEVLSASIIRAISLPDYTALQPRRQPSSNLSNLIKIRSAVSRADGTS